MTSRNRKRYLVLQKIETESLRVEFYYVQSPFEHIDVVEIMNVHRVRWDYQLKEVMQSIQIQKLLGHSD